VTDLIDEPSLMNRRLFQTVVTLQYPANVTDIRFLGLRVFLESSGDAVRDERNVKRFNERINKMQRDWEDGVLGCPRIS
jgi:hypothetical protein